MEFRKHIESRFLPGMGWHNAREWHLDHIRPCASFDLTRSEDVRECYHYSNYRPLWARDNLRKGSMWRGMRHKHKYGSALAQ